MKKRSAAVHVYVAKYNVNVDSDVQSFLVYTVLRLKDFAKTATKIYVEKFEVVDRYYSVVKIEEIP
jgi:hypothetical protein